MEAILATTTKGHTRLERPRAFCSVCRGTRWSLSAGDIALRAKGKQPLAPQASRVLESGVRSNYHEGGKSSSGSAMPSSDPQRLELLPLEMLGLEQETEMTDAPVKQQRVPTNSA